MTTPTLSPTDRVIALLRTVNEAREAWDTRSSGGGALLMPTMWHEGSYVELERCLLLMREGGPDHLLDPVTGSRLFGEGGFPVEVLLPARRQLWWHTVMRYRYGDTKAVTVAVRPTRRGPELLPPPRSEIVAGSAVIGSKNAIARVYTWSDNVDARLAADGLEHLTGLMFGGRHDRIQVPVGVLHLMLGMTNGKVEEPEPVAA